MLFKKVKVAVRKLIIAFEKYNKFSHLSIKAMYSGLGSLIFERCQFYLRTRAPLKSA